MKGHKSLLHHLIEAIDHYKLERRETAATREGSSKQISRWRQIVRWLTPNGGTLLLVIALIATAQVWAKPLANLSAVPGPSATTVNYQGRLADNAGMPLDGAYGMSFALYDAATEGTLIWGPESHTAVPVSEGLFSVGLGSQTSGGIPTSVWNGDRYLEITVGGEILAPRELIRSVPIAGMALTVPDGAIGSDQIADGAVTQEEAPNLLSSANGSNKIIRWGNSVFESGTDDNGLITITYPCFPNDVNVFMATNGHYDANPIRVIGHNGGERCSTEIKMNKVEHHPMRINWIAIGN